MREAYANLFIVWPNSWFRLKLKAQMKYTIIATMKIL